MPWANESSAALRKTLGDSGRRRKVLNRECVRPPRKPFTLTVHAPIHLKTARGSILRQHCPLSAYMLHIVMEYISSQGCEAIRGESEC